MLMEVQRGRRKFRIYEIADHCTEDGCLKLAERIDAYWAERGYSVNLRPMPVARASSAGNSHATSGPIWGLRSDMINGMPTVRTV